jgi:hypothetical protein
MATTDRDKILKSQIDLKPDNCYAGYIRNKIRSQIPGGSRSH